MENRLILAVALSQEQSMATKHLMDMPGLCACGRYLKALDKKFVLGQINSVYSGAIEARNTVIIAIYCESCFIRINNVFSQIKDSYRAILPDTDLLRGA